MHKKFLWVGLSYPNKPIKDYFSKKYKYSKSFYKVDYNLLSYAAKTCLGTDIAVLKPVPDHISLVFNLTSPGLKEAIIETLVGMKQDKEFPWITNQSAQSYFSRAYVAAVAITEPESGSVIGLFVGPKNKQAKHDARVQFNPSGLGVSGMSFFREMLEEILFGEITYWELAMKGRVTRVDVAVDLVGADINGLLFDTKPSGKSHAYFGEGGELETIYFGVSGKNSSVYAYDKALHLSETNQKTQYGGAAITRIEFRVTTNLPLVKLKDLKNPLEKLGVLECSVDYLGEKWGGNSMFPEADHNWWHFLDSCKWRGVEQALSLVPENFRAEYQAAFYSYAKPTWRTEKLWTDWPDSLERLTLLEP